jgi:splicing factor 3A subunit 3
LPLQVEIYEDADNARKDDIASLRGENVFANFYDRLKETIDYHRRFSTDDLTGPEDDADAALALGDPHVSFSGEEAFGRFLDLHELHQAWQNATFGGQVEYAAYVAALPMHLDQLSGDARKNTEEYSTYLKDLLAYLESFYERSRPLSNLSTAMQKVQQDFEDEWDARHDGGEANGNGAAKTEETRDEGASPGLRQLALMEAKCKKLCELLSTVITDTRARVEKRQSQTWAEIEAERAEAAEEDALLVEEEEDDEDDDYLYNPLKLPLGWDGKPIPYWLYKLHGLNKEFKCEICGGASYWGRRAFEKHFKEAAHQSGMKALGIPNTKQFFEVTSIADALALWKTMQEREGTQFKAEDDEEYEDAEGNVYSKKVYEDLKRQGLI